MLLVSYCPFLLSDFFITFTVTLQPTPTILSPPSIAVTMSKPIVLHLGDAIKYNHDFYNTEFASRFEVVRNDAENREQFIEALKNKK